MSAASNGKYHRVCAQCLESKHQDAFDGEKVVCMKCLPLEIADRDLVERRKATAKMRSVAVTLSDELKNAQKSAEYSRLLNKCIDLLGGEDGVAGQITEAIHLSSGKAPDGSTTPHEDAIYRPQILQKYHHMLMQGVKESNELEARMAEVADMTDEKLRQALLGSAIETLQKDKELRMQWLQAMAKQVPGFCEELQFVLQTTNAIEVAK